MDLFFTPEQQALKDAVRRFCNEQVSRERLAAWENEPEGIDAECRAQIAELGWYGLGVPETAGGSGLSLVEVACLLQECARGLIPQSVTDAVRCGWALGRLDPRAPELDGIATGARRVTLALNEEGCRDPACYQTALFGEGAAARVSGEKWYVAGADSVDWHVVAAREGDGISLVLVAGDETETKPLRTFDGERQAIVRYRDAPVHRRLTSPGQGGSALRSVRREQAALALAEMIGGMDAALEMTVAYVKEREQFGRKIGAFQAVQHQIADMAIDFTASRHLTWQVVTRMAAGTEEGLELDYAAAFVGQAFKRVTLTAHHLHGGAGYVIEHPLHYHAERAQSLCIRYAPEAPSLDAVVRALLD